MMISCSFVGGGGGQVWSPYGLHASAPSAALWRNGVYRTGLEPFAWDRILQEVVQQP